MKGKIFVLGLLGTLLLAGGAAFADEPPVAIERIVVTSSRWSEDIARSTKNITIIDQEDIEASNAPTIPDILRTEAGIHIRDYAGTGKTVNVDMRGFGETGPSNLLVLIDGRRVNAVDLSNTDWSQIPLSHVERIEIVRGSGSVLYGDSASGGVVNIITKKGKGRPYVKIEERGGSYWTSATALESGGASEQSSYRFGAELFETEGYRDNSDLARRDFAADGEHAFNDTLSARWSFGYHSDDYRLPGSLRESRVLSLGRRASTTPNDMADTTDWFTNLSAAADGKEAGKLESGFSFRTREVNSRYEASSWRNENHTATVGVTPKYSRQDSLFGAANRLIFGADIIHIEDDILDGFLTGANDKIEITKDSFGLYAQDEIRPGDGPFSVKVGTRHEAATFHFKQITQVALKDKSNLIDDTYETGLNYKFSDDAGVYLDYGTSFRHPLVDEFFASNTYGFGGLNASLSTQKGKNVEAGFRCAPLRDVHVNLNYFHQRITNEIFYDPATFANTNYDHTVHQGIEVGSDYKLSDRLGLFANYTYTDARFGKGAYKGKKIPAVPQHKGSCGLRLSPIEHLRLNLVVNYVGEQYLISDQANAYPRMSGYTTADVNLNYTLGNFEFFWGLNNIFDVEYSEYGVIGSGQRNFYPAPGRNAIAGCRYKF